MQYNLEYKKQCEITTCGRLQVLKILKVDK